MYDQTTLVNFQSLNLPLMVCVMMFFLILHAYFCHCMRKDHIPQGMLDSLYTYNGSNLGLFVVFCSNRSALADGRRAVVLKADWHKVESFIIILMINMVFRLSMIALVITK